MSTVVFTGAAIALLVTMALTLARALLGPTLYDRILSVNSFGTKTVLLIGVHGFLTERPEFLDIALAYALINFIGTVAVLKFFEYGDLGAQSHAVPESTDRLPAAAARLRKLAREAEGHRGANDVAANAALNVAKGGD